MGQGQSWAWARPLDSKLGMLTQASPAGHPSRAWACRGSLSRSLLGHQGGLPAPGSPTEHVPAPQPALPPCHAPATWDEGTTAILIKQAGFERDPRCGLTPPARGRAGGRDAEVPPRAAALGRWAGAVCGLKAISTTPFPFFIYLTVINISQLRKQIERLNDTHKVTVQEKGGETPGFQLRVTSRPGLWGEAQW